MADLAVRAQRLSDEIEVTNLQHQYGYLSDRRMWNEVAKLFASDGTMEIGLQGVYVGTRSIRRGLNASAAEGAVNDHILLQTIVSVMPDGRSARARGSDVGMTIGPGGKPLLSQSIHENEFVKQNGVWKFKTMHVYPRFIVDAEQGWGKDAQPASGPSKKFPPDKPPTEKYEIYPRFHIAPFHFVHPVTGRAPHYPDGTRPYPGPLWDGSRGAQKPRAADPSAAKTAGALESLLTATERSVARSKAYHASENVTTAYGYAMDDSKSDPSFLMVHQVVQPVITVSAEGRSSKIRARLFQLGGPAGGDGSWTSGLYENTAVDDNGGWKLSTTNLRHIWTAPSRGGWAGVKK
jgi:hypothetical protein